MPAAPLTVTMLAAIDEVARESATVGLLLDLPDAVVVGYDLTKDIGDGALRRVITDNGGRLEEITTPLDHACLSCTVREDLVAVIERLRDAGRWATVVIALPLTAAPEPMAFEVSQALADGRLTGARLSSVVSVVDLDTLRHDLLGDDLLSERGLAGGTLDQRSVGEALVSQVEYADVVVTMAVGHPRDHALIEHLVSPTSRLHHGWDALVTADLLGPSHDTVRARRRVDPLAVQPVGAVDRHGVWTLDLRSARPIHPGRLFDHAEELSGGEVRARGHFWLPSRPGLACVWDGSGGQVSIGHAGEWGRRRPRTRLVITGVTEDDRARVETAFDAVLMTPAETECRNQWLGVDDGLTPWLGEAPHVA